MCQSGCKTTIVLITLFVVGRQYFACFCKFSLNIGSVSYTHLDVYKRQGYYTVELSDPQVKAELTASIHAALHRYTYNKADSASLLIDLQHGPASVSYTHLDVYKRQVLNRVILLLVWELKFAIYVEVSTFVLCFFHKY